MKRIILGCVVGLALSGGEAAARKLDRAATEAVYAEWLQHQADRQPELSIAMTSDDFLMVNNTTTMDRASAAAFVQAQGQFILSRQCVNQVVAYQELQNTRLLLSRVDCIFQTVIGPLDSHVLETFVISGSSKIVYDASSDLAAPSLP